ncbi:MAG: hypothetical protein ABUS79_04925 [Pseudomonadota bacterium]
MKKSSALLASLLMPVMAVALAAPSCNGGESASGGGTGTGSASGSGGASASGGRTGGGSGGSTGFTTGGSTGSGTGGSTGFNSGGSTGNGTGGSTGFNSGGSTGNGTGGSTGAGTGGTVVAGGMDNASAMNGYIDNGTWKGYAFTSSYGTGVSIMPMCDDAGTLPCFKTAAKHLCAAGSVPASDTAGAQLGFNLNQAMLPPNPVNTVTPGQTGLSLTLSGSTAGLRVQIQAGTSRWCANVTGPSTMIPWTMFNTMCWNAPAGVPFAAGTPISSVAIVAPGTMATASTFNFCLVDVRQY